MKFLLREFQKAHVSGLLRIGAIASVPWRGGSRACESLTSDGGSGHWSHVRRAERPCKGA